MFNYLPEYSASAHGSVVGDRVLNIQEVTQQSRHNSAGGGWAEKLCYAGEST